MANLLVIDDEESICWGLQKLSQSMGHSATVCSSAEAGLAEASRNPPDLIVLDVRLPGVDGLNAMESFRQVAPGCPIVIMTAYGELDSAVTAIRNGAFEYLPKPFDLERVQGVIQRALAQHRTKLGQRTESDNEERKLGDIVGSCAKIQEVFRRIAFAATSNASVLINGESGTGKELAARAIHRYGDRADKPFVAVNLAALSPSLAESELFGHVKSSFTGADHDRVGLLVQANGGTLFLDELAEIPLPLQVKLLRCLDQGEVLPIGSNQPVKTDIRIISATHQDLPTAVANGKFRHDLFFRICAFQIDLPPLRDREGDSIELAEFFIRQLFSGSSGASLPRLDPSANEEIRKRQWNGNVRELRNAIEHALILSRGGDLMAEHFPEPIQSLSNEPAVEGDELQLRIGQLLRTWTEKRIQSIEKGEAAELDLYGEFLSLLEPDLLSTVMEHVDHQYVAASRILGIHRTTLKKKMLDHGMERSPG